MRPRYCLTMIYGAMGLGGPWDSPRVGEAEASQALAALRAAKEVGIDTIDTADIYKDGYADKAISAAFQADPSLRDHFKIQTKFGIHLKGVPRYEQTPDRLKESLEGSLDRLGADHIDVLLIHRPDPLADKAAVGKALMDLLAQKVIGAVGVSNMHSAQLQAWARYVPLAANQLQLSLGHHAFVDAEVDFNTAGQPSFDEQTIEWCLNRGVQIQAWSPLDGGLYTADVPAADPNVEQTRKLVHQLAQNMSVPPEAIVLAWLEKHPAAIVPVIGTTKPERIWACARAREVHLERSQWYDLYQHARGRNIP